MYCEITKEKEKSFAVILIPVPDFPTITPIHPIVHKPLFAVVAATCTDEGWSFIFLPQEVKECISTEMRKVECKPNEWVWCELHEEEVEAQYGCFIDYDKQYKPYLDCVIDYGEGLDDCTYAQKDMKKEECRYWQKLKSRE